MVTKGYEDIGHCRSPNLSTRFNQGRWKAVPDFYLKIQHNCGLHRGDMFTNIDTKGYADNEGCTHEQESRSRGFESPPSSSHFGFSPNVLGTAVVARFTAVGNMYL